MILVSIRLHLNFASGNISDIFGGERSEFEHQTLHSKQIIAIFEEYEVKKFKNEVPGTFFHVKYHPFSAAMFCGLCQTICQPKNDTLAAFSNFRKFLNK